VKADDSAADGVKHAATPRLSTIDRVWTGPAPVVAPATPEAIPPQKPSRSTIDHTAVNPSPAWPTPPVHVSSRSSPSLLAAAIPLPTPSLPVAAFSPARAPRASSPVIELADTDLLTDDSNAVIPPPPLPAVLPKVTRSVARLRAGLPGLPPEHQPRPEERLAATTRHNESTWIVKHKHPRQVRRKSRWARIALAITGCAAAIAVIAAFVLFSLRAPTAESPMAPPPLTSLPAPAASAHAQPSLPPLATTVVEPVATPPRAVATTPAAASATPLVAKPAKLDGPEAAAPRRVTPGPATAAKPSVPSTMKNPVAVVVTKTTLRPAPKKAIVANAAGVGAATKPPVVKKPTAVPAATKAAPAAERSRHGS
jgi:hypothetical protein